METYFASARRASGRELQEQVMMATCNPVIDGILRNVGGLAAVLNEHRQILALNEGFLPCLKVRDMGEALGLRPGEALGCVHSGEMAGGCGTTKYCSTCGAVIAIVTSMIRQQCVERKCVVNVRRDGGSEDLCFAVRACPLNFDGARLVLLFLQDTTDRERQAELDRMFYHDVANILHGLVGAAEVLTIRGGESLPRLGPFIRKLALQLNAEFRLQRSLSQAGLRDYHPRMEMIDLGGFLGELGSLFENHDVSRGKTLLLPEKVPELRVVTDLLLLHRVLVNMLTNAFEATGEGGEVRLEVESAEGGVVFSVWNRKEIPAEVALRVFERHFSTKADFGRGLGTYSMKVFGEKFLGGKVDFTSAAAAGTTFRFHLPARVDLVGGKLEALAGFGAGRDSGVVH